MRAIERVEDAHVDCCDGVRWSGDSAQVGERMREEGAVCTRRAREKRSLRVGISVCDLARGPRSVGIYRGNDPRV